MKKSKFKKWCLNYDETRIESDAQKDGWNAACESILRKIKTRNKNFEGNWQHEDIEYLMEEIKEMIER
jgi:hypothetical protein